MSAPANDDALDDLDPRLIGCGLTPAEAALLDSLPVVLHAPTYDRLFDLGIHGDTITGRDAFGGLHVEEICLLPGARFEFSRDMRDTSAAALAIIIPCQDESGVTVELAAWRMDTGEITTWRGEAMMLGEDYLGETWDEDGVRVFPNPTEWLRFGRRGVVMIDVARARWRLINTRLIVTNSDFGRRLRNSLRLPEPQIFVDSGSVAA